MFRFRGLLDHLSSNEELGMPCGTRMKRCRGGLMKILTRRVSEALKLSLAYASG